MSPQSLVCCLSCYVERLDYISTYAHTAGLWHAIFLQAGLSWWCRWIGTLLRMQFVLVIFVCPLANWVPNFSPMQGNLFLYKQRFALRRCLQARHCDPCSSTISCPQSSIHLGQKSTQCLCKTPPPIQASCSWRKNRFFIADVSIHLPHNIWLRHPNCTTTWFVIVCGGKKFSKSPSLAWLSTKAGTKKTRRRWRNGVRITWRRNGNVPRCCNLCQSCVFWCVVVPADMSLCNAF